MTRPAEPKAAPKPRDWRHAGRSAALQMLYQWEVGRVPIADVGRTFWLQTESPAEPVSEDVREFAFRLAEGVVESVASLDPLIASAAEHWRLDRMNVVDRIVLRLATYELLHEPDTPVKVVINEALELARAFSGDEAVPFVNGILDAIRRTQPRA
jgi:transcription antitermination protein NusB